MKNLTHSTPMKITAGTLFTFFTAAALCLLFAIAAMIQKGFYTCSEFEILCGIYEKITYENCFIAGNAYTEGSDPTALFNGTNFFFTISDSQDNVLISTMSEDDYMMSFNIRYPDDVENLKQHVADNPSLNTDSDHINITGYISSSLSENDKYSIADKWVSVIYSSRFIIPVEVFVLMMLSVLLLIFMIAGAGHKDGTGEIVISPINKIPFDLFVFLFVLSGTIEYLSLKFLIPRRFFIPFFALTSFIDILLFLVFSIGVAVRCKSGTLFKNLFIFKIVGKLQGFGKKLLSITKDIPLVWKTLSLTAAVFAAEFFCLVENNCDENFFVIWFVRSVVLMIVVAYLSVTAKKLYTGGKRISDGDLSYIVDTSTMMGDWRRHGEHINNINILVTNAVEKTKKSEQFKTELIANVSHDIKTPLTSIITYADLIKNNFSDKDKLIEYIDVIDRQSIKLKKLIEDLIEVSNISTGNLKVNLEECEIGVLLAQSVGEYKDRLAEKNLELVEQFPKEKISVMADSDNLWRVFDNLLCNICKYSQPHTRVYLSLTKQDDCAIIAFRNISNTPLTMQGEEYLERFVREDYARNTEGNGLGLSIAKSLVELQNGKLSVICDGDLFKIAITFKALK